MEDYKYTGKQKMYQLKAMLDFLESLGHDTEKLSFTECESLRIGFIEAIKTSEILNNKINETRK